MDVAGPIYDEGLARSGISDAYAHYVEQYSTNPNVLGFGTIQNNAEVNIHVNPCNAYCQPNCTDSCAFGVFCLCCHSFAWNIFAAVYSGYNFKIALSNCSIETTKLTIYELLCPGTYDLNTHSKCFPYTT